MQRPGVDAMSDKNNATETKNQRFWRLHYEDRGGKLTRPEPELREIDGE